MQRLIVSSNRLTMSLFDLEKDSFGKNGTDPESLTRSSTKGKLLILRKWGAAPSCTEGKFPAGFLGLAND